MKKITLLLTFLTIGLIYTSGQTTSDTITMNKVFGGYQFYQGDQKLNMNQLVNSMKPNQQAYKQIKSAQSTYTMGMIFNFAGGFLIGYPIGTALGGGEPNWTLAGIGAGLFIVAIPISQSFNKKARQAVDTYNAGLQTSSFWKKNILELSMNGNSIGLALRF